MYLCNISFILNKSVKNQKSGKRKKSVFFIFNYISKNKNRIKIGVYAIWRVKDRFMDIIGITREGVGGERWKYSRTIFPAFRLKFIDRKCHKIFTEGWPGFWFIGLARRPPVAWGGLPLGGQLALTDPLAVLADLHPVFPPKHKKKKRKKGAERDPFLRSLPLLLLMVEYLGPNTKQK